MCKEFTFKKKKKYFNFGFSNKLKIFKKKINVYFQKNYNLGFNHSYFNNLLQFVNIDILKCSHIIDQDKKELTKYFKVKQTKKVKKLEYEFYEETICHETLKETVKLKKKIILEKKFKNCWIFL